MKQVIPLLMLSTALAGCSSTRRTASGETIYFKGTTTYERKAGSLAITAEQAKERVAAYFDANVAQRTGQKRVRWGMGSHQVMVGDAFVFTMPSMTKDVSLSGYYVDGNTGEVSERNEGSTRYPSKAR